MRTLFVLVGLAALAALAGYYGAGWVSSSYPPPVEESVSLTWDDAIWVEETSFPVEWPHGK